MKLTVVIVSYNVEAYLCQCLLSLRRSLEGVQAEVFVVDNHSSDGSVLMVRERFPEVRLIASNHNLGFARANNAAIRQSDSDYVLLLNPDTFVAEDTIRCSLDFMDAHPQAGGLGVRMLKDDGSNAQESRRGLPSPAVAFYKMCGLCARYPRSRRFGHYYMGYLPWDEAAQIEVISGAFCMLRRTALDAVGLLDEDFFMYGEDIDLSYRLLKGGYQNWYFPASILHYKGESTQKSSFRYVHVFYDAMLIFFRKHYANASLLLTLPVKAAIHGRAFIELLRMQVRKARRSLGFVDADNHGKPFYLFLGTADNMARCRLLAQEKGLEADFIEASEEALPDGHHTATWPEGRRIYAIYDTSAYSFGHILRIFSDRQDENIRMGTYLPETNTVITTEEVFT